MTSVCIIDYGLGNLTSVVNALELLGIPHEVSSDPERLHAATHLILPGVGSFAAGMDGLTERNLVLPLKDMLAEGKPLLGICLGMQLLADVGFENGEYTGLGVVPGKVEKIPVEESHLPLPHIGWNEVVMTPSHPSTAGLGASADFYFVHSYRFVPTDPSVVVGVAEYGAPVAAIVEQKNIWGAQFHPEKSGEAGMQLLQNFVAYPHA